MKSRRRRLIPYFLIAPTLIYLAAFFAYPMFQAFALAIYDDEAALPLLDEPSSQGNEIGRLTQGTRVDIADRQGNQLAESQDQSAELGQEADEAGFSTVDVWFLVEGEGTDGADVTGWMPKSRLRIRDEAPDGTALGGTIRPPVGVGDPFTVIRAQPNEKADEVGTIGQRETVSVIETASVEVWYQVVDAESGTTGWAPSRYVEVFSDEETGRIDGATAGEFTGKYFDRMTDDRKFTSAWQTTLLLMIVILPLQFVLAMAMALVVDARLRFGSGFLYVFALPMGMSDLAVGILFFSIFSGSGLINSFLDTLGLIDSQILFLTSDTRSWIIFAIVLAELWRSTSIVMVILVSGLQAIPRETLEAAELFGASYWQRVRHIVLPLLKPSIQVALILRTILAFQVFAVVIALSGGDVVTVLANEAFRQYRLNNDNVASAYAILILALSIGSAFFYLRAVRHESEVEAV